MDILNTPLIPALGWTLIHSLWQGALALFITWLILRTSAAKASTLRYAICTGSVFILAASLLLTFLYLYEPNDNGVQSDHNPGYTMDSGFYNLRDWPTPIGNFQQNYFIQWVDQHMKWWVIFWAIGVFVYLLRFAGGLWYIQQLRRKALPVQENWSALLGSLSRKCGIHRLVKLSESYLIDKPLVIGWLKPIILLPVGILSGLPPAQIEAILLHELAHVQRHDFIINLLQALVEALLFFNPFVWALSAMVRREREHCCDDRVINCIGDPIHYVYALAQIEEMRYMPNPSLAMALNNNKFQVLQRIQRIMKKNIHSPNNNLPKTLSLVLLLAMLLASTSWLTIGSYQPEEKNKASLLVPEKKINNADTTIKENKKSATYKRKSTVKIGADGQPEEVVVEEFEGDEELRPLIAAPDFDFIAPDVRMYKFYEDTAGIRIAPRVFSFGGDSLNFFHFFKESPVDEKLLNQWTEKMKELYKGHEKSAEEWEKAMEEWNKEMTPGFSFHFKNLNSDMDKIKEELEALHELKDIEGEEGNFDRMRRKFNPLPGEGENYSHSMERFEGILHQNLVKDGYIKAGEKIKSISWDGEVKLTINGRKIKEEDAKRYRSLNPQFFRGKGKIQYE